MKAIALSLIILSLALVAQSQKTYTPSSEWRGEGRSGHFTGTDLLDSWPEGGPVLSWMLTELPRGYSSMSFWESHVYLTGVVDTLDVLVAVDSSGEVWRTPIGRAWTDSFSDSRSTPTVDGDRIYVSSGFGDLACVDARNGQVIWTRKASEEFGGSYGQWGLSESLLVDEALVYFTPGGAETTTIALDKSDGSLVWKSPSLEDKPAYVSPILIHHGERKLLVNVSSSYIFAVDVVDGSIAFKESHLEIGAEKSFSIWHGAPYIKTTTPIYHEGEVWISGGYEHGSMKWKISEDGRDLSLVWQDSILDVHVGGAVLVDGRIYGSSWINNSKGNWVCLDWESGKAIYDETWENKGSVIYADGKLYVYEEKRGHVALVKPGEAAFTPVSHFRIHEGSGPHWAHPAIHDGRLYVRHGHALMVYDIAM